MSSLKSTGEKGEIEVFIKEREADSEDDLDKLDEVIKLPTRGSRKATRPASSQDASDD